MKHNGHSPIFSAYGLFPRFVKSVSVSQDKIRADLSANSSKFATLFLSNIPLLQISRTNRSLGDMFFTVILHN